MLFRSATFLALGAHAALASPLQRRQETSASPAITGTSASTSTFLSGVAGTQATTAVSSVTSALASAVSAVSGSTTAPAPTATTSANATSAAAYAFGCPDGYSLTYGVGVAPYPGVSLDRAYSALQDWGTAIPPPIMRVSSEGMGVGATRMWTLSAGTVNLSVFEVLTRVNSTSPTFLEQEWNLTSPITVSQDIVFSNYTAVLSLYSNSTTNATTTQLFINACVSDQPAGLTLLSELITAYLSGIPSLISNSTSSSGSGSSSATDVTGTISSGVAGVTNTVASGVTGVVGTVTSGASGAIETVTSGAGGVASTITSGAGGVINTITSGADGVVNTITSGAGGVVNTITSGGASVLSEGISAVTGIFPSFA